MIYKLFGALMLVFTSAATTGLPAPDPDDGGLQLAPGFDALIFADNIGPARHLTVNDNGDVYVALRRQHNDGGIAALRDTTGDGRADLVRYFGDVAGTGIDIHDNHLYFGTRTAIVRFPLADGRLVPEAQPQTVAAGFPEQRAHAAKTITFDQDGHLYVNSGAPSNACMEQIRTRGSPGREPCPELERTGGVWRFDAATPDQTQQGDGVRFATGLRHCVALQWNDHTGRLYAVMHGRDQLSQLFPQLYSDLDNAELPAEEFHLLTEGADAGWPYTYWDGLRNQRMVAPEYGGDGRTTAEPGRYQAPIQSFPAHWAPNDLIFYHANQFPEPYRHGAFIAWHGSWNRAPFTQRGYKVTFTPFDGERPSGEYEVFADGFTGVAPDQLMSPRQAQHRPMGLAVGPDGSLYVSDSVKGRIWRIIYTGE